ncbi:MAG: ParB N-terminal domain-containing protein, partial [Proteobacteria bacterium]|nr:ParB N-terminal domain-containing protein [Pseudomonadota bacterium]
IVGATAKGATTLGAKLTMSLTSGKISSLFGGMQKIIMRLSTSGLSSKISKVNPYDLTATHGISLGKNKYSSLKSYMKGTGKLPGTIKVHVYNVQKYIVDGHHRARAAKEIGWLEVEIEEVALPYLGYKTPDDLFN